MPQRTEYFKMTEEENKKMKSFVFWIAFIGITFFLFFPLSILYIFFFKNIKNYVLKNIEELKLKEKFNELSLENSQIHQKKWYWVEYKKQKQEEILEKKEEHKNTQTSFYEQNRKKLQEKFSEKPEKKSPSKIHQDENAWKKSVSSGNAKNNNFFWNNKKSKTFWSGKSIWDDYESVTTKFSSNKK